MGQSMTSYTVFTPADRQKLTNPNKPISNLPRNQTGPQANVHKAPGIHHNQKSLKVPLEQFHQTNPFILQN